jgi:hypothetical protein
MSLQKISPKVMEMKTNFQIDLKILVEDSNSCTGEFAIYSLVELYMRRTPTPANIIFVGAS